MIKSNHIILILLTSIISFQSCKSDEVNNSLENVVIHFSAEPDFIHPMISTHSTASQVEKQIFQPLIEIDPNDLMFKPVLAEKLSQAVLINDDLENPIYEFEYTIRQEANWNDGKPVVAKDYEFTVKAANNPLLSTNSWKSFLSSIDTIILDKNDPKYIKVRVNQNNYFAEVMSGNFSIYPQHHYDPNHVLDSYTLSFLRRNDSISDPKLIDFTNNFQSSLLGRDSILGSGPYNLSSWQPQRQISLNKNENWWGTNIDNLSYVFKAHPQQLTYVIVPDEITSVTLLQEGKIDVMGQISPSLFERLLNDSISSKLLNFYSPNTMKSYYLGLNGWDPILKDKNVRKALAHCLDVDLLITTLMKGYAKRITGPIHPQKPYYNDTINPIQFDLKLASSLLDQSDWHIEQEDVFRSKIINGEKRMLTLEIIVTQKELGKKLALLLKNNAALIGVEITIKTSKWSNISKKLKAHEFQITPMVLSQQPGKTDLSQSWHSSSTINGKNYYGFGSQVSDELISSVNQQSDEKEMHHIYRKIQSILYENQPVIFLFTPTASIAINKRFEPVISSQRPGYFESLFIPSK